MNTHNTQNWWEPICGEQVPEKNVPLECGCVHAHVPARAHIYRCGMQLFWVLWQRLYSEKYRGRGQSKTKFEFISFIFLIDHFTTIKVAPKHIWKHPENKEEEEKCRRGRLNRKLKVRFCTVFMFLEEGGLPPSNQILTYIFPPPSSASWLLSNLRQGSRLISPRCVGSSHFKFSHKSRNVSMWEINWWYRQNKEKLLKEVLRSVQPWSF